MLVGGGTVATRTLSLRCRVVAQVATRLQVASENGTQPGWYPSSYPSFANNSRVFQGPRLWQYSAHDATVSAVLAALGLYDGCVQ